MSTNVEQHEEKIIPKRLADGEQTCDFFRVASIAGIGCDWIVWVNMEVTGNKAYVVCAPNSGPYQFIAHWGETERNVTTFTADDSDRKNAWRVSDAAIQFAAKSASDEVLAEYN